METTIGYMGTIQTLHGKGNDKYRSSLIGLRVALWFCTWRFRVNICQLEGIIIQGGEIESRVT